MFSGVFAWALPSVSSLLPSCALLLILAACLVVYAAATLHVPARTRMLLERVPGPRRPALYGWLLGNIVQIFRSDQADMLELQHQLLEEQREHGIIRFWLSSYPLVMLFSPEFAEVILHSSKHMDKTWEYDLLRPWLGTGLVTSSGNRWRQHRKILTPSFHFKILEEFVPIVNEHAATLCQQLEPLADGHTPFDIFDYITLCTLDTISETAMGKKMHAQTDRDSAYVNAVSRLLHISAVRHKSLWYWNDTLFSLTPLGREWQRCLTLVHDTTNQVIRERMQMLEDTAAVKDAGKQDCDQSKNVYRGKRLAFLDTLIAASENLTQLSFDDIREEVDTFMFAGHDTTTSGINWAIYLIGLHPDVQAKLHSEVDEIFDGSDRLATADDIKKMVYLECVLKETLRIFPPVPATMRKLVEDETFGDFVVPKGSAIIIYQYFIHRDPRYFPDPERFDPERFTTANSACRHPFAFVPFSAGSRNCIGQKFAMMELKVVLASLLRRFTIRSTRAREDMRPFAEITLKPKDGIVVVLTRRR